MAVRRTALGLLAVAIGFLILWFIITRDCAGQADLVWYFVIPATVALAASAYLFATTTTRYQSVRLVVTGVIAAVGGFGIYLYVVYTSLDGCIS